MPDDVKINPRDPEFQSWPLLTYYYGLGFTDLMRMPLWLKQLYVDSLPRFIARDRLRAAEATLIPWMEASARDALLNEVQSRANDGPIAAPTVDKPKFDSTLRSVGIGVKRVEGKSRGRVKPKVRPGQRMAPAPKPKPEVTDDA